MASGGLRASSLSTVTNLDVGQKDSNSHSSRHWLYCVFCVRALFVIVCVFCYHVIYFFGCYYSSQCFHF